MTKTGLTEERTRVVTYGVFEDGKLIARFFGHDDDECNADWAFRKALETLEMLTDEDEDEEHEYYCRLISELM